MAIPQSRCQREHGLDALRVFAFLVLILYHSGMGFVTWEWHVKSPEKSTALEWVMLFANRWRLPLLFFISGAGVAFSLRRRTIRQFAGERIRRLFVPLLLGMFVLVPPQIYLERLSKGVRFDSYLAFYRTVFDLTPYPAGSLSWHHLWFVAYLLAFSLCSIPLFTAMRSGGGRRVLATLPGVLERWGPAVYLINVPNLLVAILLGPYWPPTHNLIADWANFTGSLLTFLWGFVFASEPRLLDLVTRRRREFLMVGIAAAATFFSLRASGVAESWSPAARNVVGNVVSGYFGMMWIFALTGYARVWITTSTPALRYATEAVYPFYIVHQTITVALVYWLARLPMGVWPKFALVAAGTFVGSWVFYEAVRRVGPLRPLFGLKAVRP
jgi:surface polysaccharide O-acyltransferase-like enzyme